MAVLAAFSGLGLAFIIWLLAAIMTGAGHGWGSGVNSGMCVFVLPGAGVALVYRDTRNGRIWHGMMIAATVVLDAYFLIEAWPEGLGMVERVFEAVPHIFLLWLVLWVGWQVVLVWTFSWRRAV